MRIVELSDYTMVVMKDSDDSLWSSVGDFYRYAKEYNYPILVDKDQITHHYFVSDDYIYSAGRLILYFKDKLKGFSVGDKIALALKTY